MHGVLISAKPRTNAPQYDCTAICCCGCCKIWSLLFSARIIRRKIQSSVYTLKRCRVLIAPPVVGFCCCGCCKIWSLLFSLHLLELLPECGIVLVVFGLFGGCWVVFDEPGEELGVVDFVAEHLLTAGSKD